MALRSAILVKRFVLGSSSPVNGLDQVKTTYLFPFARNVWSSAVMTGVPHHLHRQRALEGVYNERRERERVRDSGRDPDAQKSITADLMSLNEGAISLSPLDREVLR